MSLYSFTSGNTNANALWQQIQNGLSHDVIVKSIDQKKHYTIHEITDDYISFSAPSRNNGEAESISYEDFTNTVSKLSKLGLFNTNTSKEAFKGGKIYKKRSPLFAILTSCGVIKRLV